MLIEPRRHFPERMFHRFLRAVTVRFRRQHDVTDMSAIAANRLIHPFRLNRERPHIVVRFPVDQQNRLLDLMRAQERRHLQVRLWSLPNRATLALKAEGRESAVISA